MAEDGGGRPEIVVGFTLTTSGSIPGLKVVCMACGWRGKEDDMFMTPDPEEKNLNVAGCPACLNSGAMRAACSADGCWEIPAIDAAGAWCSIHSPKAGACVH